LFSYWQLRSSTQLEASLDNGNYNDDDLITIRVPFNVPYQAQVSTYERVSGEIEVSGSTYRYVKRKFEKGQLVLLCIPDVNKTVLRTAKNDYTSRIADVPCNGSKNNNIGKKQITASEYEGLTLLIQPITVSSYAHVFSRGRDYLLTKGFKTSSPKPPRSITTSSVC
jgi:hypothetical protein